MRDVHGSPSSVHPLLELSKYSRVTSRKQDVYVYSLLLRSENAKVDFLTSSNFKNDYSICVDATNVFAIS